MGRQYQFEDIVTMTGARGGWTGVIINDSVSIGHRPAYVVAPMLDEGVTITTVLGVDIERTLPAPEFKEGTRYQVIEPASTLGQPEIITLLEEHNGIYTCQTLTGRKFICPRWHLLLANPPDELQ